MQIVNRNHWTELPIPSEVITQVEESTKSAGLFIDDTVGGLSEISGVNRNSIETTAADPTEMTGVDAKATRVVAETTR